MSGKASISAWVKIGKRLRIAIQAAERSNGTNSRIEKPLDQELQPECRQRQRLPGKLNQCRAVLDPLAFEDAAAAIWERRG
jgi:hypothetical protein